MRRKDRSFAALSAILLSITLCTAVYAGEHSSVVNESPIVLRTQGSFTVGGATLTHKGTFSRDHFLEPQGQTAYGDHAYVFYQIPVDA